MRRFQRTTIARQGRRKPACRRGFTIFEVAVSAVVLGAVITMAAQLVHWSVSLHQVALKKRCALEAATTVLDRMSTREWSSITADAAKKMSLPAETKEFLGDPRLAVAVMDEGEQLRGKKISVEISWAERAGKPTQRVHLATWVFPPGADK